jgi:hypothetical protein
MTDRHVMLDLETFGTSSDAAVMAIGACRFDPREGWIDEEADAFEARVDLGNTPPAKVGALDPATVEWWLQQDEAARLALLAEPRKSLQASVADFNLWIGSVKVTHLWSNGPTFDEVILRAAYRRVGRGFPIHYRASRCCRTLHDLARRAGWKPTDAVDAGLVKHRAMHDAIRQARGACEMYAALGLQK